MEELEDIMKWISEGYDLSEVREITMEANPDHLTKELLQGALRVGVNRLSVGVQALCDNRLKRIGRRHTAVQAVEGIKLAQKVGFENISGDLIFGFDDLENKEWKKSIEGLINSKVQHISAYQLSIEKGSRFAKERVQCASDKRCLEQFNTLRKMLKNNGFEQYEISSFAKQGFQAKHNSGYWSGREYLGFGPSAHSYNGKDTRSWNVSDLREYINHTEPQKEVLSKVDLKNEFLMTRLRTAKGFSLSEYVELFGVEFTDNQRDSKLIIENDWVRISAEDFFVADSIISDYFVV